jgi:hypothetical protein
MRGQFRATVARSVSALALSAVIAALVVAPAGAATAAGSATWTIQKSPNVTLPGGGIQSVSCVSATSCTAVGSFLSKAGITDTLAEAWNGKSWRKQNTPNPPGDTAPAVDPVLSGVSCPTAGFCEAVGSYSNGSAGVLLAEIWNGTSWTMQSVPAPAGSTSLAFFAVSCTSATFCEAVGLSSSGSGDAPLAEVWDGTSWQVQSVPGPAGQSIENLHGVSCTSATFCEAVGSPSFADTWNGTSWAQQSLPASVSSVSCVSASFCAAAGSAGTSGSATWDGTSWTAQPVPAPSGASGATLHAVSCTSAQVCEAVGEFQATVSGGVFLSLAEAWNGTSWSVQSAPSPAGVSFATLNGVSCPADGSCEAGGQFGQTPESTDLQALAEAWNGSSWALQDAAAPPGATTNGLSGVSCVTADFCEAVGTAEDSAGNTISLAENWNGTQWTIQATPEPAQASNGVRAIMRGVSCVSADFCEAVGFSAGVPGASAWIWDGNSWTAQAVPGVDGLASVSCTSADFCLAAGGGGETATWDGSAWSQQPAIAGFSAVNSVSCASASFCEAVGDGPSSTQQAAAWDGTAWSVQTTPVPANGSAGSGLILNGVSCAAATSCEAVGFYFTATTFDQLTLAEQWNGTAWAVQSTPNPKKSTDNDLLGVSCTSPDSCAAVGDQTPSATLTLAQSWDGTSWTEQSSANRSKTDFNALNSVSCTAAACTAVGAGADQGSINATLAETNG